MIKTKKITYRGVCNLNRVFFTMQTKMNNTSEKESRVLILQTTDLPVQEKIESLMLAIMYRKQNILFKPISKIEDLDANPADLIVAPWQAIIPMNVKQRNKVISIYSEQTYKANPNTKHQSWDFIKKCLKIIK